ncbi:P protein [Tibrovirus congo]|uniref:P protein n=1 Tax=Tibrovirus congo TaxID=1987017 RepID=K0A2K1_9RHAB|nr:P protein [Tibrovirus congo]AFS65339.1 P protein [Tibrovirus congo]
MEKRDLKSLMRHYSKDGLDKRLQDMVDSEDDVLVDQSGTLTQPIWENPLQIIEEGDSGKSTKDWQDIITEQSPPEPTSSTNKKKKSHWPQVEMFERYEMDVVLRTVSALGLIDGEDFEIKQHGQSFALIPTRFKARPDIVSHKTLLEILERGIKVKKQGKDLYTKITLHTKGLNISKLDEIKFAEDMDSPESVARTIIVASKWQKLLTPVGAEFL